MSEKTTGASKPPQLRDTPTTRNRVQRPGGGSRHWLQRLRKKLQLQQQRPQRIRIRTWSNRRHNGLDSTRVCRRTIRPVTPTRKCKGKRDNVPTETERIRPHHSEFLLTGRILRQRRDRQHWIPNFHVIHHEVARGPGPRRTQRPDNENWLGISIQTRARKNTTTSQNVYCVRPTRMRSSIPLLEPGPPRFFWWYENSE